MWNILRAREQKPFTSFQDMMDRTEITDPAKLILKRIIEELSEEPKYRLFTRSM
jgi:putative nucleotide binding protein